MMFSSIISTSTSIILKIASFLAGDIMFLLFSFFILFILTMYLGKGRVVSIILAFYLATFLYKSFPFITKLTFFNGETPILFNKLIIFLVFLIPIYLIINSYILHTNTYGVVEGSMRTGGFAMALLIILVLFSYTTINLNLIHDFGSQMDAIFTGEIRVFWWSLAPLALLALL